MKRILRDPVRFDVFRAFAAGVDTNLYDRAALDRFKATYGEVEGISLSRHAT
jgi:hypothetical protein